MGLGPVTAAEKECLCKISKMLRTLFYVVWSNTVFRVLQEGKRPFCFSTLSIKHLAQNGDCSLGERQSQIPSVTAFWVAGSLFRVYTRYWPSRARHPAQVLSALQLKAFSTL